MNGRGGALGSDRRPDNERGSDILRRRASGTCRSQTKRATDMTGMRSPPMLQALRPSFRAKSAVRKPSESDGLRRPLRGGPHGFRQEKRSSADPARFRSSFSASSGSSISVAGAASTVKDSTCRIRSRRRRFGGAFKKRGLDFGEIRAVGARQIDPVTHRDGSWIGIPEQPARVTRPCMRLREGSCG